MYLKSTWIKSSPSSFWPPLVRVSMAAGSSIFRLVHIPTRPLLSPVSEIYGVVPRVCASGPESASVRISLDPFLKTNWKTSNDRRGNQGEKKLESNYMKCTVKNIDIHRNATHRQASKHSLMSKSQDCWVAALSRHREFMSALWMQAGKQQTASQRSGCWSRTVTRARARASETALCCSWERSHVS